MPGVGARLSGSSIRSLRVVPVGREAGIWTVTRLPGSASVLSMPVAVALTSVTATGDGDGARVDGLAAAAGAESTRDVDGPGVGAASVGETLSMTSSGFSGPAAVAELSP